MLSVLVARDGHGGNRAVGAPVFAHKAVRVGQHLASGGGVEGAAFGVLDARVEVERGPLGPAGIVDALGGGQRVDVVVIEIEVAGERSQLRASGRPASGSSEVTLASSSAELTMRSMPAAEKSLVQVLAARWPTKTRMPSALLPASFSVSTSPRRTTVENSEPSRTTHSAADAPRCMARFTASLARAGSVGFGLGMRGSRVVVISIKLEVRSQIEEVKPKSKVRSQIEV